MMEDEAAAARALEERVLRSAVLAGDATAWRVLHDRAFEPFFVRMLHRSGRDRELAEEVVQESWMIAVRKLRQFDPTRGSFEAWLFGIGERVLKNAARHAARRRTREGARVDPATLDTTQSPQLGRPRDPTEQEDLIERIALTMARLPELYRSILRAKYEEDLTVVEIAERGSMTPKAAESLLTRARAAFRAHFGKETR